MPRIGKLKELPKKVIKITEENRYKVQLWDIFTFSIEKWKWMYWRVVCIEPVWGIWWDSLPGLVLIYIYIRTYQQINIKFLI